MARRKQTTIVDAALLRQMVQAADKAMAREKISRGDTPQDRLFAILMARLDVLQSDRARYVDIIAQLRAQPPLFAQLAPLLMRSMKAALQQANIALSEPRLSAQAAGLCAVYAAALHAWEKDTTSDLSATMRALDQNLGRASKVAAWLGFEAA